MAAADATAAAAAADAHAAHLLTVSHEVLCNVLRHLDSDSLANVGAACGALRTAAAAVEDEVYELAERQRDWQRMSEAYSKLGFLDGLDETAETDMQAGFEEGFAAGARAAFTDGYYRGVIGALGLFAAKQGAEFTPDQRRAIQDANAAVNAELLALPAEGAATGAAAAAAAAQTAGMEANAAAEPLATALLRAMGLADDGVNGVPAPAIPHGAGAATAAAPAAAAPAELE